MQEQDGQPRAGLARVHIVLVRPKRPANVAAACRAMKNMGLASLRLVQPPPGLDQPEARALAYGAWEVLDQAARMHRLDQAVADATLVVGTSGREDALAIAPRALAEQWRQLAGDGSMAIVFGPEASGLTNEELDLLPTRVHIPCDPGHGSLNLAQAVLVLAYELRMASPAEPARSEAAPATAQQVEAALAALREALLAIGYLNADNPDAILAEIRRLLARARPTPRETSLLRGMARQILWAAHR